WQWLNRMDLPLNDRSEISTMIRQKTAILTGVLGLILHGSAWAGGRYFELTYPPSTVSGSLRLAVTYTLWVPDGAPEPRGLIIHQHGCGRGANLAGITTASDLHWQALAQKWDCALLGPYYQQTAEDGGDCELWWDPRNGSQRALLNAIERFATQSG